MVMIIRVIIILLLMARRTHLAIICFLTYQTLVKHLNRRYLVGLTGVEDVHQSWL